jgi:hypothetical protein
MTLTTGRLKYLLHYDPETGAFTRRVAVQGYFAGTPVGHVGNQGHLTIRVDRKLYLASRLAWLYVNGQWPEREIDHRDCDSLNNRIANLREATRSQNEGNKRKYRNNKSGFKGVCWNKQRQKWIAQIMVNRVPRTIGFYDDPALGHQAYLAAAVAARGEFARAS